MNIKHYLNSAQQAFMAALLIVTLLGATFFMVEPKLGQAATDVFTIKQTITGELSFLVVAPDVVMDGSLAGVTGGTSNGTTTAVITTNSSTGYTMSIAFEDNAGDSAMYGDSTGSDAIHDYTASSSEPTYGFHTASTSAVFGYTAFSTTTASDIDASFKDDGGGNCGSGTGNISVCWMEPTVGAFQIVDSAAQAYNTGATTSIAFKVYVPNAPSPAVETDTYTATATLTAVTK